MNNVVVMAKMEVLWIYYIALLALLAGGGSVNSTPERDRDRGESRGGGSGSRYSSSFNERDRRFHHGLHDDSDDHYGDHSSSSIHHDPDSHLHPQGPTCEPIKVGLCMGIGYNQTLMPNSIGHESQADADALLQTYNPLIQYGCSSDLKLFLCSAHLPMCTDKIPEPIGPCRAWCESVKSKCEPVLTEFGFEWPESLQCKKFHQENTHENLCNPGPGESYGRGSLGGGSGSTTRHPSSSSIQNPSNGGGYNHKERFTPPPPYGSDGHHKPSSSVSVVRPSSNQQSPSSNNDKNINKAGSSPTNNEPQGGCDGKRKIFSKGVCYLKCSAASLDMDPKEDGASHALFTPNEKYFARNYALLWAVLSLSAAFIALTLSVCSPRFSLAERPILYVALCQGLYSIGVIIGSTSSVSCFLDKATGITLLAKGEMIPSPCAFVFLLTYFFGTATTMWWLMLSLSWLTSLNRSVESSLLKKEAKLFHLLSWGISSLLTSAAIIHKKVDTDELTGICGVGYQDVDALTHYNLIPLIISLSIGLMFLTSGLMLRIFFPDYNLPLCKFKCFKRKDPATSQNRMAGCELSNNSAATTATASHQTGHGQAQLQQTSNFRGHHQGYSPVLIVPPQQQHLHYPSHHMGYHHHGYSNCHPVPYTSSGCMCSSANGGCCNGSGLGAISSSTVANNNNGLLYSTGNSPASVVGVGGFQTLKALESTKAIWMRIGIFALVHSLPIACQVGTIVYELYGREDWEHERLHPNLQIFLLRLNMNLIAGLTTGVWVLSTYSWKSLLTFTCKLCNCLQFPKSKGKTKQVPSHPQQQKLSSSVPNSVVAPLLPPPNNVNNVNLPPIPVPSGSSSSSNNHNSTMPILGFNNTFTVRGALAPQHNISNNFHRNHYSHPVVVPPVPPRNPDHIAIAQAQQQQQRTDVWRRGETIV